MNRILMGIFLSSSLGMAGIFSIVPALPAMAIGLGITDAEAAYLISSFTLGTILVAPFVGLLADKVGRRYVLTPSLLLFGLAGVACGLCEDFTTLLVLRFIQGMGAAALGALAVTILSDLYQGPTRVRYFGWNMTATSMGMMFYPFMGGVLGSVHWRYPFFLSAIALPIALYVHLFLRYEEPLSKLTFKAYVVQFLGSLSNRRVLLLSWINFTVFFVFAGAFLSFFSLLMLETFSDSLSIELGSFMQPLSAEIFIGLQLVLFSIMVGIISFNLGALHQRFGFNQVLATALFFYALSLLWLQSSDGFVSTTLAVALLGLAHGCTIPSMVALYTRLAPEGMTGSYVILNSLVFRVGQTVGPIVMAVVLLNSDVTWVFVAAGLVIFPVSALALWTRWRD